MSQENNNRKKSLKLEILEKISGLAVTGFGLVAALAWNDTIKLIFAKMFPKPGDNIIASLLYAIVVTVIVVLITVKLGNLINKVKGKMDK